MSTQKLLQGADKLLHANKVVIRDLTPAEQAISQITDAAMLVCLLHPTQPRWAHSAVIIDLNRVDEEEYRKKVLTESQVMLNELVDTLQPNSRKRHGRGRMKEKLDYSNICERAKGHVPNKAKVEQAPEDLIVGPESEFVPAVPPEVEKPKDLAGKIVQRKQRKA